MFDPLETLGSLASRERKTERSIRMTLSLAFLDPDIVKAAVDGRLPRGYGLKRLRPSDGVARPMPGARIWGVSIDKRRRGVENDAACLLRLSIYPHCHDGARRPLL